MGDEKNEFLGLSDSTRKILERVEQEYANSSLGGETIVKEKSQNNEEIKQDEPSEETSDHDEKHEDKQPQVVIDKIESNEMKSPEYNWKIERLMNDEAESKVSFAPSDFMSLAQSDIVNVDDSISQIDFSQRSKTPQLPKALAELSSEVSQSTEKLLAIKPQSIMINPIEENSIVSLQTEHMAAEFNRVQRNLDANFGMPSNQARSTVSVKSGVSNVSIRTEVIQREILDILGTRARKLGVTPPPDPPVVTDHDSNTSLSQSTVKSRQSKSPKRKSSDPSLAAEKVRAELKLLYVEKKQVIFYW